MTVNIKEIIADKVVKEQYNVRNDLQHLSVPEIREHQPKNNFAVAIINVTGELNVGTIIRSAVIFGADKIYMFGRKRYDKRSVVGAHNYIDIEYHDIFKDNIADENSLDIFYKMLKVDGYQPIICDTGGVSYDCIDYFTAPCFIFGNEGLGVPEQLIEQCSLISIQQHGVMRSLNVSVAAGIIMNGYVNV